MEKVLATAVFFIMFICFLANPAPVSIEPADVLLIGLPFLIGFLSLATTKSYKIYMPERNLLIAVMLYLSYLLFSLLLGLIHGIPIFSTLRSLGPYLNFFPLILMGFLPVRLLNPWVIAYILMLVGLMQACYQFYLYLTHSLGGVGTMDVLRSRITLIEPRTTLPIILSITILPMVFFAQEKTYLKIIAASLILFGLFAGAATLTRSIVISIFVGWLTFFILHLYKQSHYHSFSFNLVFRRFLVYFLALCATIILVSFIPKIYMLEQGLFARFNFNSSLVTSSDYTNGRLYDEWIPALYTWIKSGYFSLLLGIGAGNTFIVASGEERTYIHNLVIYSLVYGGIYGLFACLWLYFTVFKTLLIRAFQANDAIYLGLAALLMSIFTYAQLFAVHKGLAFNAMLFLIITMALMQPDKRVELITERI